MAVAGYAEERDEEEDYLDSSAGSSRSKRFMNPTWAQYVVDTDCSSTGYAKVTQNVGMGPGLQATRVCKPKSIHGKVSSHKREYDALSL